MSQTPHKRSPVDYSSQEIDNESWNDAYKIKEEAAYGYQASTDSFKPVQLDSSGNVLTSATFSGTVTTAPTFKDDPTNAGETPKFGKTNSTTHKQMVEDDYGAAEPLAEQAGAGAALTFTFLNGAVNFVWVTDVSAVATNISHADCFGGTPTNTQGSPVFNQAPTPISVLPASSTIKVFAPAGATINVVGYRRS